MDSATTPPVGTHQGQATPPAGTPAPQGCPSLLLWENPLFSDCWDKDEKGRGFLEGRAAGTVWGNTRQGLCCDKAPAGARGLEGLSDKRNRGEAAPAALNTPKTPFYPEHCLQGLGGQRGVVSPRPHSQLSLHALGSAGCSPFVLGILLTSPLAHSQALPWRLCQTPLPAQLCRCLPGSVPAASPG